MLKVSEQIRSLYKILKKSFLKFSNSVTSCNPEIFTDKGLDDLIIVKDFGDTLKTPKTREITDALSRLGVAADDKVLIILSSPSEVVQRSVRNLEKVKLIAADQLNVFDLLHANSLLIGEKALATIQEVYGDD